MFIFRYTEYYNDSSTYGFTAALHVLHSVSSPPEQPVPSQLEWQAVHNLSPAAWYVLVGQEATHAVPTLALLHDVHFVFPAP